MRFPVIFQINKKAVLHTYTILLLLGIFHSLVIFGL